MGLFDEKEYEFKGQYARYCRALGNNGLFKTFREAYVYSSLIGFLNGEKSNLKDYENNDKASIFASDMAKRREQLRFIYHMIMLLDEEPNFTIDDYKNRTFRDEADEEHPEKLDANMRLFNSYAEGGLEYLYNQFGQYDNNEEVIDALHQYVMDFAVDIGLREREIDLNVFE